MLHKRLLFTVFGALLCVSPLLAQFEFLSTKLKYEQNFDGLGTDGIVLPVFWKAYNTANSSDISSLLVSNGDNGTGGAYNFGTTMDTDRALGTVATLSNEPRIGMQFLNSTGERIVALDFDFFVEQWRTGSNSSVNEKLTFEYSLNATSLSSGNWTAFPLLDINEILTASTASVAVDGNLNRSQVTRRLTGLNWSNNSTLWIRWNDTNDSGDNGGYAIDDLSITAVVAPPAVNLTQNFAIINENVGRYRIDLQATSAPLQDTASVLFSVLTVAGSATADPTDLSGFTGSRIKVAPGSTTGSIFLSITDDKIAESDEYIIFSISDPQNCTIGSTSTLILFIRDNDRKPLVPNKSIELELLSSFSTGAAGANSAEVVAYDSLSKRLFSANSISKKLDIIDYSNPRNLRLIRSVGLDAANESGINSVAAKNGMIAFAVEALIPQNNGRVVFIDAEGNRLKTVTVGAMPDHLSFTPDGKFLLTANEGEPNNDYTQDPEGSVSIIDLDGGVEFVNQSRVSTVLLNRFNNAQLRSKGVRLFGPNSATTPSRDLEPEYIAYSADSKKAYVMLQENNAVAIIDIATKSLTDILGMGMIDVATTPAAAFDASDHSSLNGEVLLAQWPVKAMFMPDAAASYSINGKQYIITANEGDAREYTGTPGFLEEVRVGSSSYVLDAQKFQSASFLKQNNMLGRLTVSNKTGDLDGDGDFDEIHLFGTRSFTIWEDNNGVLERIYDSGNDFERITLEDTTLNKMFNASNTTGSISRKNRSDNKGPEPEGVAIAKINNKHYAFVCLERIGGIMVYDVSNPAAPEFVQYVNNRSPQTNGPDLGPEAVLYIEPKDSPIDTALVVIGNEVSSTITTFKVKNVGYIRPPASPSNLVAVTDSTTARNRLTWRDNATDELNYVVERAIVGSATFDVLTATLPPNTTSYTDMTSRSGVQYTYRVKATNNGGSSGYAVTTVMTSLENQLLAQTALLFPVPASAVVYLGLDNELSGRVHVRLFDAKGAEVMSKQFEKTQPSQAFEINTQQLSKGIYLLKVSLQNAETTLRLVIE